MTSTVTSFCASTGRTKAGHDTARHSARYSSTEAGHSARHDVRLIAQWRAVCRAVFRAWKRAMLTPLCGSAHWVVRLCRTPCRAWAPGLRPCVGWVGAEPLLAALCRGRRASAATPIRRQSSDESPDWSLWRPAATRRFSRERENPWGPRGSPPLRFALAGCDSGWPRSRGAPGLCPPTRFPARLRFAPQMRGKTGGPPQPGCHPAPGGHSAPRPSGSAPPLPRVGGRASPPPGRIDRAGPRQKNVLLFGDGRRPFEHSASLI